jgi:hypothetical protein
MFFRNDEQGHRSLQRCQAMEQPNHLATIALPVQMNYD